MELIKYEEEIGKVLQQTLVEEGYSNKRYKKLDASRSALGNEKFIPNLFRAVFQAKLFLSPFSSFQLTFSKT